MGAFLDKPKTEKQNEHGSGNGLSFGLSSMQGWRVEMEDAHTAVLALPRALHAWSFFGVYDGHAGSRVATYCAQHLLGCITASCGFEDAGSRGDAQAIKSGIRAGFLHADEELRELAERSGSTAVALLVSPRRLYFINCGDSRAVLCRSGTLHLATHDHKPGDPLECERIVNAGGSVTVQRVNGSLAVSRALGDFDYKRTDSLGPTEQQVSPEPDVFDVERADADQFAVLACDGVWDVMSNEELCQFVKSRLQLWDDLEKVCDSVLDTCLHKGSRDNMSMVLVCFSNRPKVSEEAVRREEQLDRLLERRVEEIIQSRENAVTSLAHIMHVLSVEDIPDLPPGGGLASKRGLIEAVYSRLNPHAEEDEDSQGGDEGSTTTHLLEALRQFRINHRGEYRQVLEGALTSYHQSCEPQEDGPAADSAGPEHTETPVSAAAEDIRPHPEGASAPPTA